MYPPRGDSARTGRIPQRHKNGEYAAVTCGRPAFQRHEAHAEGSDTTPMQERRKSAVCRREQRVRRRRAPTLRKPFFCRNKPRAGLFRHSHSGPRVVIPPPHRNAEKMQNGSLITSPNRAPAETQRSGFGGKRTSDRESESCRLRRDEGFVVRSDDSQHRICLVCGEAAALPNALGGAWPHTPFSGRSPHPLKAASVSAETLLPASGGAASKGDQSPFEEPPALRGDERNHFRKVIDYEKRYQIQHAHGVRRP